MDIKEVKEELNLLVVKNQLSIKTATHIVNAIEERDELVKSNSVLGVTASSVMSDCYKYGMTYGCDVDCPVLKSGNCELQDTDNKELYKEAIKNES